MNDRNLRRFCSTDLRSQVSQLTRHLSGGEKNFLSIGKFDEEDNNDDDDDDDDALH